MININVKSIMEPVKIDVRKAMIERESSQLIKELYNLLGDKTYVEVAYDGDKNCLVKRTEEVVRL